MPDETEPKIVIAGDSAGAQTALESADASDRDFDEGTGRVGGGGVLELDVSVKQVASGDGKQPPGLAEANLQGKQPEAGPANGALAEDDRFDSFPASTSEAPASVSRSAAEALNAASEQTKRDRNADAGDTAALAQALRTFLDAFASQNSPTRSEFRDLASRLDRLSSQYAKGR